MTKKRISKRVREEAWLVCAVQASTPDDRGDCEGVATELGLTREAGGLAWAAWTAVTGCDGIDHDDAECYAEAAALLAEGWCPP